MAWSISSGGGWRRSPVGRVGRPELLLASVRDRLAADRPGEGAEHRPPAGC